MSIHGNHCLDKVQHARQSVTLHPPSVSLAGTPTLQCESSPSQGPHASDPKPSYTHRKEDLRPTYSRNLYREGDDNLNRYQIGYVSFYRIECSLCSGQGMKRLRKRLTLSVTNRVGIETSPLLLKERRTVTWDSELVRDSKSSLEGCLIFCRDEPFRVTVVLTRKGKDFQGPSFSRHPMVDWSQQFPTVPWVPGRPVAPLMVPLTSVL